MSIVSFCFRTATLSFLWFCMLSPQTGAFLRQIKGFHRTTHPNSHRRRMVRQAPQVIVLAGPTAVGKSDVAAKLCESLGGIIVSADSVQAYKGVQIGANKPTPDELAVTPHLLVDVADHTDNYNAASWRDDAVYCIQRLLGQLPSDDSEGTSRQQLDASLQQARNIRQFTDNHHQVTPIIVGGTMMYLQWLVHGRPDSVKPTQEALRQAVDRIQPYQQNEDWEGATHFVSSLGESFASQVATLAGGDWYRLRRILEVYYTIDESDEETKQKLLSRVYTGTREGSIETFGYDVRCFFLCPNDRMKHTRVIDERCENMIERGLLSETANLYQSGTLPAMAEKAIGYRQVLDYLLRENPQDQDANAFNLFLENFTTATRQYAKRQMQWFRKDNNFVFVPVDVTQEKTKRVNTAHDEIIRLCLLSRVDFDHERLSDQSLSSETRRNNENQGFKMKTYQFRRSHLKEGSALLVDTMAEADELSKRLRNKRKLTIQNA